MYICNFYVRMRIIVDMMQNYPNAAGSQHAPDCFVSESGRVHMEFIGVSHRCTRLTSDLVLSGIMHSPTEQTYAWKSEVYASVESQGHYLTCDLIMEWAINRINPQTFIDDLRATLSVSDASRHGN